MHVQSSINSADHCLSDIPRLTGSGVKIGWSFVDRGFRLYIDDSLKAVSNSPVTTYTLSLATTLYLGFPSSTYNESALLVGLTIRDWKMWLYSPFFVHLPGEYKCACLIKQK